MTPCKVCETINQLQADIAQREHLSPSDLTRVTAELTALAKDYPRDHWIQQALYEWSGWLRERGLSHGN